MGKELKRVYITQDDDGHNYVIPYELKDEFKSDLEGLSDENIYEWDDKYGQFSTGGDVNLIDLYAKI